MCRKLILLLIVFGVIAGLSSVASALPLIGEVVRSGGNSDTRDPIGFFDGSTPPLPTQAGGWTDGNYCFSDRTYTWANTPDEVDGAEYVRTFNTDKSSSVTYTVTFPIGATVLLTCDDRFDPPQDYVDNIVRDFAAPGEFTDTGWDVHVFGDSDPPGRQLSVYSAPVEQGTYVFHDQDSGSNNFYIIGALYPPVPVRKAYSPDPEDGSRTLPTGEVVGGYYMLLQFTAGYGATTHTAYFSDVEQEVIDRNLAVCLEDPPYPEMFETGYYVGLDDENIPEFARTPLDRGVTYYWVVDESNDTAAYPGDVWSFTIASEEAWGPTPEDGAELVSTNGTMTWNLGDLDPTGLTLTYDVYIGTDATAVADANVYDNPSVPEYMGYVGTESYDYADLDPETEHFWRVDTKLAITRPPFTPTITPGVVWSFTTGPPGIGGILREWWTGITGTAIADLTSDPRYPSSPDGSEIVDIFEGPTDVLNDYGSRIHGWLYVTQTGDYTFWIATDDNGELWLSTDMNPANASLISTTGSGGTGWADVRQFDDPDVTPSGPIHLEAGNMYYISGLMKEGGGGDNIAVAWECLDNGLDREVIPGSHLIPYAPVVAENPDPADRSPDAPLNVTLSWTAGIDQSTDTPYTTQHVYLGSDPVAVANATTASPEYMVSGPTGPNEYGPLSLSYYDQVYWRIDGVVASSGTVEYPGAVWTFQALPDPAQIPDANLKLWLKFEDDVLDSSGHGRHGTEMGGPTYVSGSDGQAIHLDGIDDWVEIEYGVGISGADPRTIAGWAKATTTAITVWTNIFGFTAPSAAGLHFDIEIVGDTDSTTAGFYGLHMNGDEYNILACDLEWHHLAATYDGTTVYMYAQGSRWPPSGQHRVLPRIG